MLRLQRLKPQKRMAQQQERVACTILGGEGRDVFQAVATEGIAGDLIVETIQAILEACVP